MFKREPFPPANLPAGNVCLSNAEWLSRIPLWWASLWRGRRCRMREATDSGHKQSARSTTPSLVRQRAYPPVYQGRGRRSAASTRRGRRRRRTPQATRAAGTACSRLRASHSRARGHGRSRCRSPPSRGAIRRWPRASRSRFAALGSRHALWLHTDSPDGVWRISGRRSRYTI